MAETENNSFFRAHRVLAFLPLVLMGAGVWYYIYGRTMARPQETAVTGNARLFAPAAKTAPAAPAASAAPAAPTSPVVSAVPGAASPAASDAAPVDGAAAARLPEPYDPKAGIDIQGSPEFKSQVTHALKLVWMADRDTFLFMKKNLYVIRNEDKTGFYMENGRPVAALSNDHAFRSLTWCAGIIAHQTWHAWYTLEKNKRISSPPPLPGDKDERVLDVNPARFDYKGLDAILYIEDKASSFQLDVLKKVGAPKSETNPVFRRAPRDFKYAHDGNYALNP